VSGGGGHFFLGCGNGVTNYGSTLTVLNSTIAGNDYNGGGVANFDGTLTLARPLGAGNTAPSGPEIYNAGTVLADNHNLFGVDGIAGVEGVNPEATDVGPPLASCSRTSSIPRWPPSRFPNHPSRGLHPRASLRGSLHPSCAACPGCAQPLYTVAASRSGGEARPGWDGENAGCFAYPWLSIS
jgi:hypothetical protein